MKIKQISHFSDNSVEKLFGILGDEAIYAYDLENAKGMQVTILNYGATVTSVKFPLPNGKMADVVLGFETPEAYEDSFKLPSAPYFGTTVGRYAGRISNGKFVINRKTHQLDKNNGNHSLHGGKIGFSQKIWELKNYNFENNPSVTLAYFSPAGESGYPGDLTVELTYTLSEKNELHLEYKATTSEDTVVNLTHHSYFNLDGHLGDIKTQDVYVNAEKILEATTENIPTGSFVNLKDHAFDFRTAKKCPVSIDTTFVLEKKTKLAASLISTKNSLKMCVFTDQPAVHIYVGGNCFGKIKGKEDADYHIQSGICFETQNFPDAPNQHHFPSALLKKGELYRQSTTYKFESF